MTNKIVSLADKMASGAATATTAAPPTATATAATTTAVPPIAAATTTAVPPITAATTTAVPPIAAATTTAVPPIATAATTTLTLLASLPEHTQINLLHQRFREYGANAKLWSRQCQLLLPEIQRQRVWRRKGFESIYDYAAKLAGMSCWAVNDALRVLNRVADKPKLMALAVERGLSRVRSIATIATQETETFWAEKAQTMSKHALEKYVSDYRLENGPGTTDQPVTVRVSLPLYPEVAKRLAALRDNLPATELNDRVARFLDRVEQEMEVRGGEHGGGGNPSLPSRAARPSVPVVPSRPRLSLPPAHSSPPIPSPRPPSPRPPSPVRGSSRYIPAAIRHYVINKYRGRCAYPTCTRPYKILHHTQRFALEPVHDPARIVPLCRAHEHLAHQGLIAKEHDVPARWRVASHVNPLTPDFDVDIQVKQYRRVRTGVADTASL